MANKGITYTVEYKVAAVSRNCNSFGLKQMVLVSRSGDVFKACASYLNVREEGAIINVPVNEHMEPQFSQLSFEIPERCAIAPADVVNELFK